jgi:prophage maintenance system killer protein
VKLRDHIEKGRQLQKAWNSRLDEIYDEALCQDWDAPYLMRQVAFVFERQRAALEYLYPVIEDPQNAFAYGEEDLVALAVRLLAVIALAHAFEQENKRGSFIVMPEFLIINGYDLAIDDTSRLADEIIALLEHRTTEEDGVRAVRPFVVER